jgi:hypothetical protein
MLRCHPKLQTAIVANGVIMFNQDFVSRAACPARVQEYLEIQYGYIGEHAIWNPELNRWTQG